MVLASQRGECVAIAPTITLASLGTASAVFLEGAEMMSSRLSPQVRANLTKKCQEFLNNHTSARPSSSSRSYGRNYSASTVPDVLNSFIRDTNAHVDKIMEDTTLRQRTLYLEMKSRTPADSASVPETVDMYDYYSRYETNDIFPIYCRARNEPDSQSGEEVVLNINELGRHVDYVHVGILKMSADHHFLGYTLATSAATASFDLYLKDLRGNKSYGQVVQDITGFEWSHIFYDQKKVHTTLFFTKADMNNRPFQAWSVQIEICNEAVTYMSEPDLVFEEPDEACYVDLQRTKDGKFITITSNSKSSSEVHVVESQSPTLPPKCISPRVANVEYYIDHVQNSFYIVHNGRPASAETAGDPADYTLSTLSDKDLRHQNHPSKPFLGWKNVPIENSSHASSTAQIEDIDLVSEYCALFERSTRTGMPQVRVFPLDDASSITTLNLPSQVCNIEPGMNQDYFGHRLRLTLSSPLSPGKVLSYNMAEDSLETMREEPIIGFPRFDPQEFQCYTVMVKSHDGVEVPMTLVHRNGLANKHEAPALLHGYGAYGMNFDVSFHAERLSLLTRGWIVAFAHVRGGGELGRAWYNDGKGMKKTNSIHDYLACAEWLIEEGFTRPELLAGHGMSAGGLLLGAASNWRPELFRAMVMKVPFVDPLGSMCDPNEALTLHEYDEWGNPGKDHCVKQYIESYSPLQNVTSQKYPAMLVTGSTLDDRVPLKQPVSWVQRIRERRTNTDNSDPANLLLLHIDEDVGHFGEGGRYGHLKEAAFEYSFLEKALGL